MRTPAPVPPRRSRDIALAFPKTTLTPTNPTSYVRLMPQRSALSQPLPASIPTTLKTRGQIEAEICAAIVQFEREYMGRGPEEAKAYLIDDMVLVRLRGVLTPAEKQLAADEKGEGRSLIKQVRMQLLEKARPLLVTLVGDILQQEVVSLHTDISITRGERIIVFSLAGPPIVSA